MCKNNKCPHKVKHLKSNKDTVYWCKQISNTCIYGNEECLIMVYKRGE